jgi:hypothetical protein
MLRAAALLILLATSAMAQPLRYLPFMAASSQNCTTNVLAVDMPAGFGSSSNSTFYATAAFTPQSNATLVAICGGPIGVAPTVTNSGTTQLVWWQAAFQQYATTKDLGAWVTQLPQGTAPFSMSVVLSGAGSAGMNMHIVQLTNASQTLAYGTNAIVQASILCFDAVASANPTNQFAAPGGSGFNTLIFAVADDSSVATDNDPTLSWTELLETAWTTPNTGLATYYSNAVPSVVTTATNTATSRLWGTLVLEIRASTICP